MFVVISRWILRRMRNVLDKSCRENENTFYVFRENLAVCEIMWKNIVEQDMPHMITWISKARKRTYTQDIATATMVTRMRLCYLVPVFPLFFLLVHYGFRFPTGLLHCIAQIHCFIWS